VIPYRLLILFALISISTIALRAQDGVILGKVFLKDLEIKGAQIRLEPSGKNTLSDQEGNYLFSELETGIHVVHISYPGVISMRDSLALKVGETLIRNYHLEEDALFLHEMVVTGTRSQIRRHDSPVVISTVSSRVLEATQSLVISEGLNFTPGLRMENNCQNCGFNQLRMNGLDGAYSQILINSRPVFSALAGVYGLEMLPANMVDRIEVVRGGGSVLYGGNAIAGTVNIITKDPLFNSYEVGYNQAFTNFATPDRTLTFNAAVVSEDLNKGITLFGFNRERTPWDANGDGYSELTAIRNTTFGFDVFRNGSKHNKLKFGIYTTNEFRRGGNNFHLEPHQTDLAEQLEHRILNATISYEQGSKNLKHKFSLYGASQLVIRSSYYGSGGSVLVLGDSLTETDLLALNAYGQSDDLSSALGAQYNYAFNKKILITAGSEFQHNSVYDHMPGYERTIAQDVTSIGSYVQLEWNPITRLTFLIGGRYDLIWINGQYDLATALFSNSMFLNVPVPRLTALFRVNEAWKLRASVSQGYRAPQAFNEDLHLETVGGAVRFIQLSQDLKTERSNSATISLNFDRKVKSKQVSAVLEGFLTLLKNPFILSDQQEMSNGVAVITKRNGDGALVAGVNLELNMAFGSKLILQSGGTAQIAQYVVPELIWQPLNNSNPSLDVTTVEMLRIPNFYGYFSIVYNPTKKLSISCSGILTGSMLVAHVIDPDTEETVLKTTTPFFENNVKLAYNFTLQKDHTLQLFCGVQNLFNSYQNDFDSGALRDAGYVYGPSRPRTLFLGIKFGMK